MPASKAASSDPVAERAAAEAVLAGGTGIDGVIAGFLAAAGAQDDVLLSPMAALVTGVGVGNHWVDGRCCQPGKGSPRPRGWLPNEAVPAAAHAATPRSLAALAVLHAHGANRPLSALVRPAATLAQQRGAERRADVLLAFGAQGARLLGSDKVSRALLTAAGRAADGLLTKTDLSDVMPGDGQTSFQALDEELEIGCLPWQTAEDDDEPINPRQAEVIVAADARGLVAALAYCPDPQGVMVEQLGLRLAGDAQPIRRGVPRVTPGTARSAPLPIAVLRRSAERWFAAVGIQGRGVIKGQHLAQGPTVLTAQLERLRDGAMGNQALAASVQRRQTELTRV